MAQSNIRLELEKLAPPVLAEGGAFLVDIAVKKVSGKELVQVYVDTERGITIDECAALSRALSAKLDEVITGTQSYTLEVSSPGAERPLRLLRQYPKHVGRTLKVRITEQDEVKDFQGVLESIDGEVLCFRIEPERHLSVPFRSIVKAVVALPW